MDYTPFSVVRLRKGRAGAKGPDKPDDLFCACAAGNPNLIDSKESPKFALLNGMMGAGSRQEAQRLCDALNAAWLKFYNG
jgi:hypothetical protein